MNISTASKIEQHTTYYEAVRKFYSRYPAVHLVTLFSLMFTSFSVLDATVTTGTVEASYSHHVAQIALRAGGISFVFFMFYVSRWGSGSKPVAQGTPSA